jgi:putative transcriptional regulator
MIKLKLDDLLENKGWTIYRLSRESGIRWGTLAKISNGQARRVDLNVINAICEALDCEPGDILVRMYSRKNKAGQDTAKS